MIHKISQYASLPLVSGLIGLAPAVTVATPVPEFSVNVTTASIQSQPATAMDADANFLVAWQGDVPGKGFQIFIRRFDSAGNPQGGEILVSDPAIQTQTEPTAAVDAGGDALVAWRGRGSGRIAVLARRYNAANMAQGTIFQVNSTPQPVVAPDAAGNGAGNFVVAFHTYGISDVFIRRLVGGAPVGTDVQVNTFTTSVQKNAAVAMGASGAFVVCYESVAQTASSGIDVYCRRFNASGAPLDASEFRATTGRPPNYSRTQPDVAMDAAGNFVVAWADSTAGIFAARFDAAGTMQGVPFQVDLTTGVNEAHPSVAMDAFGRFVISWDEGDNRGSGDGNFMGTFAQRFNADGTPNGSRFQVNTYTTNNQQFPSVAMNRRGAFGIAWESNGQEDPQDKFNMGVYAALYDGPSPPPGMALYTDPAACSAAIGSLPVQVSFDDLAPNTDLSGQTIHGVSFVSLGNTLPVVAALDTTTPGDPSRGLPATSGANLLSPGGVSLPLTGAASEDSLEFDFINPVSAFRFDLSLQSLDYATYTELVLYDASNHFLADLPIPGVPGNLAGSPPGTLPVCVVYNQPVIAKVQLLEADSNGVNPDSNIGIDSLGSSVTGHTVNFTGTAARRTEAQAVALHLTLTPASSSVVTVPFTLSGTASPGSDYTFTPPKSGVTFNPGVTQQDIVISGIDDALNEATETVIVRLGTPVGADLGNARTYTLRLTDNDPPPTVAFDLGNETVTEGGAKAIKVTLSAASGQTITVPFTIGGSATRGIDYTPKPTGLLKFTPGVTSKSITLTTIDDSLREPDETVVFTLGNPTNATLGSLTVNTMTIKDND
jgi:hypothetical protein